MTGTKAGGYKAAQTNKIKYGNSFYRTIGQKGGRAGHTGGFAANPELARIAGQKGGRMSSRTVGGEKLQAGLYSDDERRLARHFLDRIPEVHANIHPDERDRAIMPATGSIYGSLTAWITSRIVEDQDAAYNRTRTVASCCRFLHEQAEEKSDRSIARAATLLRAILKDILKHQPEGSSINYPSTHAITSDCEQHRKMFKKQLL